MRIAQIPGGEVRVSPNLINTPYSVALICYLLSEGLVKRGHKVTLFVTSDSKTSAKIAPNWYTSRYCKKYLKTDEDKIEFFKKYCQNVLLQAKDFDIFHVHEIFSFGILRFLKKNNLPLVATLHSPTLRKKHMDLKSVNWVALSQSQMKNNPKVNFVGKVHNGIPFELYPFSEKPGKYLFFIGRISPEKGVLEAIQIAKESNKKLLIAGPFSPYPNHLNYIKRVKKALKENKKNIVYLGTIKNFKQKVRYLKNAFAVLFPIKWEEPFGLVMIEAMACGTPVIAFNRGAVPEIIKDGVSGFIVKTREEMVQAIEKIEMLDRKKCREWVKQNFTVEKMVEGYEKIYQKLIMKYHKI